MCPEERAAMALRSTPRTGAENTQVPLGARVAGDQRYGELALAPADLAPVALERKLIASSAQAFAFTQKPSENFVEGFHRERVPARGGCGLRG
jgi:hypothetical protein